MKKILITFGFILLFLIPSMRGTHIIAGFASYEHLNDNSYEIKYTLIRDLFSSGANFDNDIFVQVYSFDGVSYFFEGNILTELGQVSAVENGNIAPMLGIEKAEYRFEYELTDPNKDYLFVYQRCCRSPLFSNIINPEENGITLTANITSEAQAVKNSSITFEELPTFIAFVNEEPNNPVKAMSIDGDELTYQFAPSLIGGGLAGSDGTGNPNACNGVIPQGPCPPPYEQMDFVLDNASFLDPFPGWNNQGMDSNDGTLLGIPTAIGQYSYGFAIHESRNGQIINTTSFDYAIFVLLPLTTSEEFTLENIKLHGNPSSEGFVIENKTDQELNYEVFSARGESISTQLTSSGKYIKIDFEGPAGMYVLKVYNQEIHQSLKLMKL